MGHRHTSSSSKRVSGSDIVIVLQYFARDNK